MKMTCSKFILILGIVLLSLFALSTTTSAETDGIYTYTVSDGKATITNCDGSTSGEIEIPNTLGGCIVVTIDEYAFWDCSSLTSITIPNSVTSIGEYAFKDCSNLTSITIPNSVTSIGVDAFSGCNSLNRVNITDIGAWCEINFENEYANPTLFARNLYLNDVLVTKAEIPDGVTSIGNYAFDNCDNLISVVIPDSVTSIGEYAFWYSDGLISVTIPDSITSIGEGAFEYCHNLVKVNITDISAWCNISFDDVKSNPLYYAKNLYLNNVLVTEVEIPVGVISIGKYAFYNCDSLTGITIPDSVITIDEGAFWDCNNLTNITIPDSVTSIGNSAFYGCYSLDKVSITDIGAWCEISFVNNHSNPLYEADNLYLNDALVTEVEIPDGVTNIGNYAFYYYDNLTSINIPDSVTSIGNYAFYCCHHLTSINIPDNITSIGNYAFKDCWYLTSISIPDSVTSIGNYAFADCSRLRKITICDSVKSIGFYAFYDCDDLKNVYYTGTEEKWDTISIYLSSDELKNATIHFNYMLNQNAKSSVFDSVYYDDTVTTHIYVNNIDTSANLYVALYDGNNKLLRIYKENISNDVKNKEIIFNDVLLESQYTVKIMIWDDKMKPICNVASQSYN